MRLVGLIETIKMHGMNAFKQAFKTDQRFGCCGVDSSDAGQGQTEGSSEHSKKTCECHETRQTY